MALSFWCKDCQRRFWIEPEPEESEEAFLRRVNLTAQTPCPECGKISEACRGQSDGTT
jgi:hypothetical protein